MCLLTHWSHCIQTKAQCQIQRLTEPPIEEEYRLGPKPQLPTIDWMLRMEGQLQSHQALANGILTDRITKVRAKLTGLGLPFCGLGLEWPA